MNLLKMSRPPKVSANFYERKKNLKRTLGVFSFGCLIVSVVAAQSYLTPTLEGYGLPTLYAQICAYLIGAFLDITILSLAYSIVQDLTLSRSTGGKASAELDFFTLAAFVLTVSCYVFFAVTGISNRQTQTQVEALKQQTTATIAAPTVSNNASDREKRKAAQAAATLAKAQMASDSIRNANISKAAELENAKGDNSKLVSILLFLLAIVFKMAVAYIDSYYNEGESAPSHPPHSEDEDSKDSAAPSVQFVAMKDASSPNGLKAGTPPVAQAEREKHAFKIRQQINKAAQTARETPNAETRERNLQLIEQLNQQLIQMGEPPANVDTNPIKKGIGFR